MYIPGERSHLHAGLAHDGVDVGRCAPDQALQRGVAGGGRRRQQRARQLVVGGRVQQAIVRALQLAALPGVLGADCGKVARLVTVCCAATLTELTMRLADPVIICADACSVPRCMSLVSKVLLLSACIRAETGLCDAAG